MSTYSFWKEETTAVSKFHFLNAKRQTCICLFDDFVPSSLVFFPSRVFTNETTSSKLRSAAVTLRLYITLVQWKWRKWIFYSLNSNNRGTGCLVVKTATENFIVMPQDTWRANSTHSIQICKWTPKNYIQKGCDLTYILLYSDYNWFECLWLQRWNPVIR